MVLADTGYWLALANSRDRWHGAAVAATRRLDEALVVTWPVITEPGAGRTPSPFTT